jgi:hypothetical protein
MRPPLLIAFFVFTCFTSCKGQVNLEKEYNKNFVIKDFTNSKVFFTLTKNEKSLDSMFSRYDKRMDSLLLSIHDSLKHLFTKNDFINNRSRILFTEISNGIESRKDIEKIESDEIPSLCDCGLLKDTLFINSGVGFFGGAGLSIKIYNDEFKSSFYQYIDNVEPFKLSINSELDKQPDFKIGQHLTGLLTLTSNNFLVNRFGEKIDTNAVKVKMYFTCITKQVFKKR